MDISTKAAISHFFPNPSFEMIYSEAFHNSLDAGASQILISISIHSFSSIDTLKIEISDNGIGFTDERYNRFSHLLQTEDKRHKGLGRLVYLCYFNKITINSIYENKHRRQFVFHHDFKPEQQTTSDLKEHIDNSTTLTFESFSNNQLKSYDNLKPTVIKENLLKIFMPKLFALKQLGKKLTLTINLSTDESNPSKGFYSDSSSFTLNDLPNFEEITLQNKELDLFYDTFKILYYVENNTMTTKPVTALCVDGRAIDLGLLNDSKLPKTSAIFLLSSNFLDTKTDDSRQGISLDPKDREIIEKIFIEQISNILNDKVPDIQERNIKTREKLTARFPHLGGYFKSKTIGILDENKALSEAQSAFFAEQKQILYANELSDEQYELSLNHATRILTEYILYRNLIIKKLENINPEDSEATIHNLIVPKQHIFEQKTLIQDIYNNNAWILDDKYMCYRTILSDEKLAKLIKSISSEDEFKDDKLRPDIALIFSDDIETSNHPVDVVIVELKKKNLPYLDNKTILGQIQQRARRLSSLYPNKIQRLWFFGIVDFDNEFLVELDESGWQPIYSKDKVFYKELYVKPVDSNLNPLSTPKIPMPVTLMSFQALWNDAQARNQTFLELLKNSIRTYVDNTI